VPPQKSRNSSSLAEGRQEVTSTTTRILQGVTFSTYSSMRNTAGAEREKKKTSKHQLQRDKSLKP
jgi:hypothetical protein